MILIDKFIDLVSSTPNKLYIQSKSYSITFEDFSYRIGDRIKSLSSVGVLKNQKVGIILDEFSDIVELLFSCWSIDAIPVLISPELKIKEKLSLFNEFSPDLIITNWKNSNGISNLNIPVFPIEELSQGFGGCGIPNIDSSNDLNSTRLILFTSGSTGTPKIVQLSEYNLVQSAIAWNKEIAFKNNDLYLNFMPTHHVGGISIFIRSLLYGFSIFSIKSFDIDSILKVLNKKPVTLMSMVPTMLSRILEKTHSHLPDSIRGIILSGGPSSDVLMRKCINCNIPVFKSYGLTETSSGVCGFWLNKHPKKFKSVGLPFDNSNIKIIDSLVHIQGPTVMKGYLGNEKTVSQWFNTGDFGMIDEDGFLFIEMRRSDQVITGGKNVSCNEIESILMKNPQIFKVKVYGEPNEDWGQIVVAKISSNLSHEEIKSWLKGKVSDYKIPKMFYD